MVKTASLYDNFCKTGNDVIDDVIIWWNKMEIAKKWLEKILVFGAFYNITKNEDNPIKTIGREFF